MKKAILTEGTKTFVFYIIAFAISVIIVCLLGGCASKMYRAPCEHRVPAEKVNKVEGAVNYCPICGKPYPYIPVSASRYSDNDDEIKWYDGFGWHWTGPYGYGRPYPYYSYGYQNYHHAGCRCDDCYR